MVRSFWIRVPVLMAVTSQDGAPDFKCEVGVLPRAHGSALFTRGETQALVVVTLGTGRGRADHRCAGRRKPTNRTSCCITTSRPISVGETSRVRFTGPGRREIGHGKLAWRAVRPLLPAKDDFPYTLRLVSEITESNGSSSMATVCGSSLSHDGCRCAAAPIRLPVLPWV